MRLSKPLLAQRKSSTPHYQTFPTKPPKSRGHPPNQSSAAPSGSSNSQTSEQDDGERASPLPKKQLAVLAVIALAEQTALNSISPYLPDMTSSFPEVKQEQVGMYVGLIASAFALAQFTTNFFWGWLSDKIGRKPIIILGTVLTAACFLAFGFCRTLWQAVLVQALMGLINGNQGVVSTCLGEITDKSNQSRAFTYLPVVYGIGGIMGPIVGGLLVMPNNPFNPDRLSTYPYLAPNVFSAAILTLDSVVCMVWLEESLEEAKDLPPLGRRVSNLFTWLWQFTSSAKPAYAKRRPRKHRLSSAANEALLDQVGQEDDEDEEQQDQDYEQPLVLIPEGSGETLTKDEIFNRDTVLLLLTFLIFQLANISYNSLYPIFAQAKPPIGRSLSPEEIGLLLGFAGIVTIVFQVGVYGRLRERIGNKTTYRVSLAAFVIAFLLTPFVGYKDSLEGNPEANNRIVLWIELGLVLVIKTVAAVGGLTSALLLITNSAPTHHVLGTLNGLAQTLSAAGRAAGPLLSGSLFTAATHIKPKGEAVAFGVFGGVAFIGSLLSFGIRGANLEAQDWDEEDGYFEHDNGQETEEGRNQS